MQELIDAFKEGWLEEDPRVVIAVLTSIAVFIALNILHSKYQKNLQKLKQQAINDKTIITAQIKSRYHSHQTKSRFEYKGRYRYIVNGKEKEYAASDSAPLPDTLELYPKNSTGSRVFSDYDFYEGNAFAVNAIASIAVLVAILFLTGYIGS
ncbi:MAG: hypothetical protein IJ451_00635 [Ruminococcus sp.]|nr:hypothetical protein [Ruminococcus sp.]